MMMVSRINFSRCSFISNGIKTGSILLVFPGVTYRLEYTYNEYFPGCKKGKVNQPLYEVFTSSLGMESSPYIK